MNLAFVCAVLLSFTSFALTQNIQIQTLPQTVNYLENDLTIVCSITNPSQLTAVFIIELQKNASTTFMAVVTMSSGQPPQFQWNDNDLQGRATPTGNLDSPSSAQLRLTIDKSSVRCPSDFSMYRCTMSGLGTSGLTSQTSDSTTINYIAKPTMIEIPLVRILNELYDTPNRQFPVGTVITLTCQGQVGSDKSKTIRWCARKSGEFSFTGLAQTPIHSEASPSGCQYTRSSTITYNLTRQDTFTRFLCESGDTGMCGTGTAIQYVNITIAWSYSTNNPTTDEGSSTIDSPTTDGTSAAGNITEGMMTITVGILLILHVV